MTRNASSRWMRRFTVGATVLALSNAAFAQLAGQAVPDSPAAAPSSAAPSGAATSAVADAASSALAAAIAGPQRSAAFRARDPYRHPFETLSFFGLTPGMKVVEIWPGNGWYTEILAPLLNAHGLLYEALPEETASGATAAASPKATVAFSTKMAAAPSVYGKVVVVPFAPPDFIDIRPPGGADLILTFRNVHNWLKAGTSEAVFAAMYAALKPGGILGVVEHRAHPGTSLQQMIDTGYMTEDYVIRQAQAAGFRLVARSEINANPRDTTDHPNGVWSLPPGLAGGAIDRQRFIDIGESDRMTLRFEKPQ